jgi:hypothetical protein
MTTIASDLLVVGSSLGGIVTAVYAARAGLRVTLLEEDTIAKQPPLLREPFLFGETGKTGPLDQVLREVGTSPVERRHLARDEPAVQVVLPEARIDLGGGLLPVATELERYGLAKREEAERWLTKVYDRGDGARAALAPPSGPPRRPQHWSRRSTRLFAGRRIAVPDFPSIPGPPKGVRALVSAVVESLSREALPDPKRAPAALLRGALDASVRAIDAGSSIVDLLRQRFLAFHGEIRAVGPFALVAERREIGVELGREKLLARAVVIAAPASLLTEALPVSRLAPGWLADPPGVLRVPTRLVRVERRAMPSGMGPRVIDASEPTGTRWILRSPDPTDEKIEWAVVRGPAVGAPGAGSPFGELAPFAGERIAPGEPGPVAQWDVSSVELRVSGWGWRPLRSRHPLVVSVGPDVGPGLGAEGELLFARRVGLWLGEILGPRPTR